MKNERRKVTNGRNGKVIKKGVIKKGDEQRNGKVIKKGDEQTK